MTLKQLNKEILENAVLCERVFDAMMDNMIEVKKGVESFNQEWKAPVALLIKANTNHPPTELIYKWLNGPARESMMSILMRNYVGSIHDWDQTNTSLEKSSEWDWC